MSEENKNQQTPKEQPKPEQGKPRPLSEGGFGENRSQQEKLRKAFEIPPKPPTPKKDSDK